MRVTALLLGQSGMTTLLAYESDSTGAQVSSSQWIRIGGSILILLLAQLLLMPKRFPHYPFHDIRIGRILIGIVLTAMSSFLFSSVNIWIGLLIFLIVVIEEGVGRWLFYQAHP